MAGLYVLLIVFPMIFLLTLIFVFQSDLQTITLQQLRMQCPYPIYQGVATIYDIDSNEQVLYTVDNSAVTNSQFTGTPNFNGTNFICYDANAGLPPPQVPAVTGQIKNYGYNFAGLNFGWFGFASDTLVSFGDKVQALFTMIWLYFNAPAEVSGISYFTYINGALVAFIGLGGYFAVRGVGN